MKGDRVVTDRGIGRVIDDDGRVWIDTPRPKGAYLPEEIREQGLEGVPVWVPGRAVLRGVVSWEQALAEGLVGPVRVSMQEMAETRGARRA